MALGEFELIRRYFTDRSVRRADTLLAIGDDCALLRCPTGMELAVSVDTLVSGVHFLPDADPESLGHKALAVNLSDLAAMGAEPAWATLALTLPEADERWLESFAQGFFNLANRHGLDLVGGDTTRGPLSITVQVMGQVPGGQALRRAGAQPGDSVYVSGPLGSAGLGLKMRLNEIHRLDPQVLAALERPEPRIDLGLCLRGLASACIDISDGLAADLGHILSTSAVGARLEFERLPMIGSVRNHIAETGDWEFPLTAGDDYELCFTVPASRIMELESRLARAGLDATAIGHIEAPPGLRICRGDQFIHLDATGYEHFTRR